MNLAQEEGAWCVVTDRCRRWKNRGVPLTYLAIGSIERATVSARGTRDQRLRIQYFWNVTVSLGELLSTFRNIVVRSSSLVSRPRTAYLFKWRHHGVFETSVTCQLSCVFICTMWYIWYLQLCATLAYATRYHSVSPVYQVFFSFLVCSGVARMGRLVRPPRAADSKGRQDKYFKF